jgi:DNA-binding LytR/AlgR family response regulator
MRRTAMGYRIAVCDDEEVWTGRIKTMLSQIALKMEIAVGITVFSKGSELISTMQRGERFDFLLLDIDMPDMDGLEVAKKVRKISERQLFAFLSAYQEYVYQSFEVQPFRFLRKDYIDMELFLAVQAAIPEMERRKPKYLNVRGEDGEESVNTMDVTYVEIWKRKLHFYLTDGRELESRMSMKSLLEKLQGDDRFVLFDSGLLVNVLHIQRYSRKEAIMKNGQLLPIARTRQDNVRKIVMRNRGRLC